jgi:transposase
MRPKGTKAELEARRRRAVEMLLAGKGVREVGRLVGVDGKSVTRWRQMYEAGGDTGLKSKPQKGRPPGLSEADLGDLGRLLLAGPSAHGFPTELWTLSRVRLVIRRRFKIKYHPCHVWKVLRRMKWSAQKPERRAREQDEAAVRRWRRRDWPRIKKGPASGVVA